eukprot:TRINITY_DN49254_c0_g1_i1.p1 TRINITY_DN49254_c0_g1~~TRINITY_DN49254_c0_g1_i1.p1  ORF type:complete len:288 (-),score=44.86 TRINITY_DN49254_c0_g1_i1:330-1193(-)
MPGATCSAAGEMMWHKTADGSDSYSLCYAPALREGSLGPSGTRGTFQCDRNSYFMVEAPRFCCQKPRIDIDGKTIKAQAEVCGDTQAEFNPETQEYRLVRGPSGAGTPEQMEEFFNAGFGDENPSPVGLNALNGHTPDPWATVNSQTCKGSKGTLVKFLGKNGRAEMCPTGTKPINGGPGYMSFVCDGSYTKEVRLHCCKVDGHVRCVKDLRDASVTSSNCNCSQSIFSDQEAGTNKDQVKTASMAVVAIAAMASSPTTLCSEKYLMYDSRIKGRSLSRKLIGWTFL